MSREVCQRLGLKAMLEGSIAALGTSYVLRLDATDCQTGEPLAREQAEATSKESVLSELGPLSSRMRTRLGESLPSIQRFDVPIEQATTPSLTALKAYALGLEERRRGRELESVAFFNQAIELDREFASAYATLSTVYGSLGEWRRSEEYARLAYARQNRVSERERLFITYQYHDRVTGNQEKAASTLELWKAAYPRESRPVNALALIHNRHGPLSSAPIEEARGSAAPQPGPSVPALEPGLAYRALGPLRRTRRRSATQAVDARSRDDADAPAALPARHADRRRLGGRAPASGRRTGRASSTWSRRRRRSPPTRDGSAKRGELYRQAIDMAMARDLDGTALGLRGAPGLDRSALCASQRTRRPRVRRALALVEAIAESPGTIPRFRAAAALGAGRASAPKRCRWSRAPKRATRRRPSSAPCSRR